MNRTMNDRKISAVYWADTEFEKGRQLISREPGDLFLSFTHHGDHDQVWIVHLLNGKEHTRYNPRHVESFTWL